MTDIDFAAMSGLTTPAPRKDIIDVGSATLSLETEFDKAISEMENEEARTEIIDDASNEKIVSLGSKANKLVKAIDARQKEIFAPAKTFEARIKKYKDRLKAIVSSAKHKTGQYQYRMEVEHRKHQKAIDDASQDLQKKLDEEAQRSGVEAPTVDPVKLPKKDKVVRTDDGSTSHLRRPWKGKIVDPNKVPREYCEPSQKKINDAVKRGIREIPGVEIKQEIETVFK